jgi:hypothetical protein
MTDELSADRKRKIEEEENYRQEVRTQQEQKDQQHSSFPWPIVFILVIIALLIVVDSPIFLGKKKDTKNNQSTIQTDVNEESRKLLELEKEKVEKAKEEKQQKLLELSDSFCKNRKGTTSYGIFFCDGCVNLDDINKLFKSSGDEMVAIKRAKTNPTKASCELVAKNCLETWGEDECLKLAEKKIKIGMTIQQLYLSWGPPKDTNDTVNSWGVYSQWVYGDFGPYVYLEGKNKSDMKVTSWQD